MVDGFEAEAEEILLWLVQNCKTRGKLYRKNLFLFAKTQSACFNIFYVKEQELSKTCFTKQDFLIVNLIARRRFLLTREPISH